MSYGPFIDSKIYYRCPICGKEYQNEADAKACERYGIWFNGVYQSFISEDELGLKYPDFNWILIENRITQEQQMIFYKSVGCFREKESSGQSCYRNYFTFYDTYWNQYSSTDQWKVIRMYTIKDAYKEFGHLPIIRNTYNIPEETQEELREVFLLEIDKIGKRIFGEMLNLDISDEEFFPKFNLEFGTFFLKYSDTISLIHGLDFKKEFEKKLRK